MIHPDFYLRARHDADHNLNIWIITVVLIEFQTIGSKAKTIEQSIMRARHANIKNNIT